MPSFYNLVSGATAQAQDVQQVINALNGTVGQGIPLAVTAVNDSVNFALVVKNTDSTNSRALQVLRANGSVLLQADVNGVIVSPDGGPSTAQVVNVNATQTISNKTFTAPVLNNPSVGAGDLTLVQHVLDNGVAASATVGAAAGASAPSPVIGTSKDLRGMVTFGTGTGPTAGVLVNVNFASAFPSLTPAVVITPANNTTASLVLSVVSVSTTGFSVATPNTPAASQANTTYAFTYVVIG